MTLWITIALALALIGGEIYIIALLSFNGRFENKDTGEMDDIGKAILLQKMQLDNITIRLDTLEKGIIPAEDIPKVPTKTPPSKDLEWMKRYK